MKRSGFHHPSTVQVQPRRRASQACAQCRARKVRCDFLERFPCSGCVTGNSVCRPAQRVRRHAGTPAHPAPRLQQSLQDSVQRSLAADGFSGTGIGDHGQVQRPSELESRANNRHQQDQPYVLQADDVSDTIVVYNSYRISASQLADAGPERALTVDDDIWARNLHTMTSTEGGSTNATISPATMSSPTQHPSGPVRKRVRFGDESLAHSILPHMDGHAELLVIPSNRRAPQVDRQTLRLPATPKAARPCGKAPWLLADCQAHLDLLCHLPADDQYYLYNIKKVFHFPQRSFADQLLRIFCESVYPILPVVSRRHVMHRFEELYNRQQSSPLLFHAIFFVACQFADEALVRDAGFDTVQAAKIYFFQRAKLLYSFDCEPDHLVVVQSLVLLSYWWMDYTEEKDMRFWLSCAVNLAFTMGMHRTITKSFDMSPSRRALWRRIFWTLLAREHNVAVALGQPFLIHSRECNLPPLTEADFEDANEEEERDDEGEDDEREDRVQAEKKRGPAENNRYGDGHDGRKDAETDDRYLPPDLPSYYPQVLLKHVDLAVRVEKLLLSMRDAKDHHGVVEVLHNMEDIVSRDSVFLPVLTEDGFSAEDESTWTKHNVFVVFHLLNHERMVTLYHRLHERALIGCQRERAEPLQNGQEAASASGPSLDGPSSSELGVQLQQARTEIYQSAERVVRLIDKLSAGSLIQYAPSFVNTTTFHALLSIAEEIVNTGEATTEHQFAKEKFHMGLRGVGQLRKFWSAASWSYAMYSNLAANDFQTLKLSVETAKNGTPSSRLQSRLPSRLGTPVSISDLSGPGMPVGLDIWDPLLYTNDAGSVFVEPYMGLQCMDPEERWLL